MCIYLLLEWNISSNKIYKVKTILKWTCAAQLSYVFFIDAGKWFSVWFWESLSQTAPCGNKFDQIPPICTSRLIKIEFIISGHHVGKAANSKWNNIVKLSKQRWSECWLWSSGTNCPVKPPQHFFFGLESSALDWNEPLGQRLRRIQNFNGPFSIV